MKNESQKSFIIFSCSLVVCVLAASYAVYSYIDKQNRLTELRRSLPLLEKEARSIQEENRRLQYEIDRFESPLHLLELARKPQYSHLRYPYLNEVVIIFDEMQGGSDGE